MGAMPEITVTQEMWDDITARVQELEKALTDGLSTGVLVVPAAKVPARRGARLPDDGSWMPSEAALTRIKSEFPWMGRETFVAEHAKFTDYWLSKAGRDAVKLDWDRTWCNWMRTAAERLPRSTPGRLSTVDQKVADLQAMKDRP